MDDKIQALIEELDCDDIIPCQQARRELVSLGSKAVGPLVEALSSNRAWVRWEAAKALGQIRDTSAVKALVAALEDREFDVRWLAAEALIRIGPASIEPLLATLEDHGDKSLTLRRGAHHVFHDMNRGAYDELLRPVMAAVDDSAPAVEVLLAAGKALDALKKMKRASGRKAS
jgi:HEAT repeat protein